jgi:hypothetical protein
LTHSRSACCPNTSAARRTASCSRAPRSGRRSAARAEAIVRWGYPLTLALDAAAGLVVLFLLPLMGPRKGAPQPSA